MAAEREQKILLASNRQQDHHARDGEGLQEQHPCMGQQWARLKHQHPCQQIKRQRQHPKQGRGGNVGGNMRGDGDQQARGDGGEKNPARTLHPARRGRVTIARLKDRGRHRRGERTSSTPQAAISTINTP